MTPIQIGYLKHYLYDSGIARQFILTYRKAHYDHNPNSVEKWLMTASMDDVIMKAFPFKPNHAFGCDYWKEVDEKWHEYWSMHEKNFSNLNFVYLKGSFGILCQNWDEEKYWIKQSKASTYERMGITPPEGFNPEHEKMYHTNNYSEEDNTPEETQEDNDKHPVIEFTEDDKMLEDFEFFDEPIPKNYRLKSDEISLNFNNNSYKITFNIGVSEEIRKRDMTFVRLGKNKNGDFCLVINKKEGTKLIKNSASERNKQNVTLNSKNITTKVKTLLNIKSDYSIINIELQPTTPDYLVYKLTKQ